MSEDATTLEAPEDLESQPSEHQLGTERAESPPEPYRFDSSAPTWAQGKTADEILKVTESLYNTLQNTYNVPSTPSTVPQQTQQPVTTAPGDIPPDPALIYTDAGEYQRQLSHWQQEQTRRALEQQQAPIMQGSAEMAKAESRRNPDYADVWSRYGPEIEAETAGLPLQMKLSPKFWNDAAALVKGRHAEELFKIRMAASQSDTGTFSSDGGASSTGNKASNMSPLERAWREDAPWVQQFKKLPGMSLANLRQRVQSMGWSESDYVKHYEGKTAMRIHRSDAELARMGVV